MTPIRWTAQRSQISAGGQPKPAKIAPVVSDSCSVAVFVVTDLSDIPCPLMSKIPHDIVLHTKSHAKVTVPQYSRFLRFSAIDAPSNGGGTGEHNLKRKISGVVQEQDIAVEKPAFKFEVAFGLPWTCEGFIAQACKAGHPAAKDFGVPAALRGAVEKHVEWSDEQMASYRIAWCRRWAKRAVELEQPQREDAAKRHPAVAELTKGKRLLLTAEMLEDIG